MRAQIPTEEVKMPQPKPIKPAPAADVAKARERLIKLATQPKASKAFCERLAALRQVSGKDLRMRIN